MDLSTPPRDSPKQKRLNQKDPYHATVYNDKSGDKAGIGRRMRVRISSVESECLIV